MPEQPSPLRQRVQLSRTLRGVLDEITDGAASFDDIGHPMRPVAALVLLVDPESLRDPEQDVVVGTAALSEFEDPLKPHNSALVTASTDKPLEERPNLLRLPKPVPTIREGEQETVVPTSPHPGKNSPS